MFPMLEREAIGVRREARGEHLTPHASRLTHNASQGFVLPAAIFLLVVLGGLAAWLMRLGTVTLAQEALELEGARAYQAAQAGLEAGIYTARVNGACTPLAIYSMDWKNPRPQCRLRRLMLSARIQRKRQIGY